MRKDLEGCSGDTDSSDAEVQAITERAASAHVTAAFVAAVATPIATKSMATAKAVPPATEEEREEEAPEEEFNTLREEDLDQLFGDPLHIGDWDYVTDLTR